MRGVSLPQHVVAPREPFPDIGLSWCGEKQGAQNVARSSDVTLSEAPRGRRRTSPSGSVSPKAPPNRAVPTSTHVLQNAIDALVVGLHLVGRRAGDVLPLLHERREAHHGELVVLVQRLQTVVGVLEQGLCSLLWRGSWAPERFQSMLVDRRWPPAGPLSFRLRPSRCTW